MKIGRLLKALWFYRHCADEAATLIYTIGAAMKNKKIDPGEPARIIKACEALIAAVKRADDNNEEPPASAAALH